MTAPSRKAQAKRAGWSSLGQEVGVAGYRLLTADCWLLRARRLVWISKKQEHTLMDPMLKQK
ncbi:hypothetical protein E4U41_003530 [Claviceps citrina]|nr:hypothetical protein E4U41_003530 [Claviceps citrina]